MAPDPRIGFEMIMLRALAFRPEDGLDENQSIEKQLLEGQKYTENEKVSTVDGDYNSSKSSRLASQITVNESKAFQNDPKQYPDLSLEITSHEKIEVTPLDKFEARYWSSVCKQLDIGGALGEIVNNCVYSRLENDKLFFVLDSRYTNLLSQKHELALGDVLSTYFGKTLRVSIDVGIIETDTPRLEESRSFEDNKNRVIVALNEDAQIRQFKQLFDGSIDIDSIVPKEIQ